MTQVDPRDLRQAARTALIQCMGLRAGESCLVVTDRELFSVGAAFWEEAFQAGAEAMLIEMIPRRRNGEEPPQAVAWAMKHANVVIIPTSKSLSHTAARREACQAGARIASLPGITEECAVRTLVADYDEIAERSIRLAQILSEGKVARLTSARGTRLELSIEGREGYPDTGQYMTPGDFGNLPAGEAYIAPVEGSANGILVVDGSMAGAGVVEDPIILHIEDGYAMRVEGGEGARRLEETIAGLGREARNVAELGIGTNHLAIISGRVLEDEKVMGTVHVALGDNSGFGGRVRVPSHLDGVILSPTLEVDGRVIIDNGHVTVW